MTSPEVTPQPGEVGTRYLDMIGRAHLVGVIAPWSKDASLAGPVELYVEENMHGVRDQFSRVEAMPAGPRRDMGIELLQRAIDARMASDT